MIAVVCEFMYIIMMVLPILAVCVFLLQFVSLEYAGPSPPRLSGPHRYQIFLFSYTGSLNSENVFNDKDRGSWNVVDFMQQNGLCNSLVAGYEFISENNY